MIFLEFVKDSKESCSEKNWTEEANPIEQAPA